LRNLLLPIFAGQEALSRARIPEQYLGPIDPNPCERGVWRGGRHHALPITIIQMSLKRTRAQNPETDNNIISVT
jgi:hypothetical protein